MKYHNNAVYSVHCSECKGHIYMRQFEAMITCNLLLGIEVQAMHYWQYNACNALS